MPRSSLLCPGRMLDVGSVRLHVRVFPGPSATSPVILEAGWSGFSAWWGWIAPRVAQATTVVTYDRMGLGWSVDYAGSCDATSTAGRLQAVLDALDLRPPYVLAGHSLGGLLVRVFAHQYPAEIAGVILLDAADPDQQRLGLRGPLQSRPERVLYQAMLVAARLGLSRPLGSLVEREDPVRLLPETDRHTVAQLSVTSHHLQTMMREAAAMPTIFAQAERAASLGDIPLLVISAGGMEPAWLEIQQRLPSLSTQGRRVVVADATHDSLMMGQPYAEQVANEITKFLGELEG